MDFRILGPLEVAHGGAPVPIAAGKQRALLADLLLNTNRAMATRRLVDDLWGDDVPDTAVKALQVYVSKLRKALPEDRLHTRDPGYLLEIRDGELDLDAFSRLAAEGRAALADGEAERASETLEQALALWRGPALLELDAPFTRVESARLGELRQSCLEDRIDADLRIGRHIALVPELEALVASLPLRERLRSQLMLALYRSGRQAEALDVYQSFRRFLDQELGIEPTQSLRELERRLLQQDPVLDAPVGAGRGTRGSTTTVPTLVRRRAVGRATELGALRGSLDRALSGTRQVAFVTGEAGAGKTTLVELLLLVATSLGEGVLVARGQCIENRGPGEPYMPLLEAIGRLGRGDRGPVVVDCLSRFAPTWLSQLPALVPEADREWVEARSLGVTRERMLREMADALDVITAETPLVLVLEDLHWSDPSTLDLVDTIARRPDAARLFVIGTYRTGHHGSHVPELERSLRLRNLCTEVAVGPLSAASVGEYLAERLPGVELPPEFAQDVHRRTRGIPLFVERLVDSWLDGGAVERHGDEWRVVVPLEQLRGEVPETLRELIAEQVRPLTVEARELLESASAVGTEFSALPAAAGAGVEAAAAERTLASIASRQQIIEPRGVERLPDGTVTSRYAFTHDLCHEWLYGELAPGRRAAIHQRIGERLEEAYGERASEIASELAWHFREGHDAPRAVGYLLDVAEHAFRRGASREAVRQVETALALVGDVPDKTLAVSLEVSARFLHGPSRIADEGWASPVAEDSLVRAVELARGGGSVEQLGQALFKLSVLYEVRGQYTRSGGLIEEALGLPPDDLSRELRVNSHELLACSLVHQGRHEEALVEADRALELLGRDVLPEPVAIFGESPGVSGHAWASVALWHLGRPESAMQRAERAVAAAAIAPRAHARGMAHVNAAIVSQCLRHPAAVRQWAEAGIEASEQAGYPYWKAIAEILLGWARVMEGDPAGLEELREALDEARGTGARLDEPYLLAVLADACLALGNVDAGLDAVDEAIRWMGDERSFFCEPELYRLRGDLLLAHGDPEGARAAFETAVEVARGHGARMYELRASTGLARLGRQREQGEQVAALVSAISEGRDSPDVLEARTLLDELGIAAEVSGAPAAATAPPAPVRYARSGDLSIAYQVTGEGPVDLLLVPGFVSHLELDWEEPRHARFLDRLGACGRLIRFDKRGTGLSDRPPGLPDLETRMDDLRTVMDAARSEQAIVFGYSEGGPLSLLLAATHPERVKGLVLFGAYAKRCDPDDDYPWAPTRAARAAQIAEIEEEWGLESNMAGMCPSADESMALWWGERCRAAASPGAIRGLLEMNTGIDVRHLLDAIHVPTLVVHRREDSMVLSAEGRYIADHIVGARFVELEGRDHFVSVDADQILDVVEPFIRSLIAEEADIDVPLVSPERVLATVMFTDIVESTALVSRLGDSAWAALLQRHHAVVRKELARFDGEEIDAAGDGVLAVFDGPARAIRCGQAIAARLRALGLDVRVGVHTGEVERTNGAVRGIAVHLAARIAAAARPDEILVSATTRDLVAGSGLAFVDRGTHELKGFDGARHLFAAS